MRWPVRFFIFSQLPNQVHNCLVLSLYQPIHLGVVGHGLQSSDTKDLAQSSVTLLVKLAHLSLKGLAGALKIEMKPPYRNLVVVFAV